MKNLLSADSTIIIIFAAVIILIFVLPTLVLLTRYKKCPSDKIMVIYGRIKPDKDGKARSVICLHGGAAFVWPFIQAYAFLDLTPIPISVDLKNAISKQNTQIDISAMFTVGISTEPTVMQNAAERLLGLPTQQISDIAIDVIFGQLRLVIATKNIEEINADRDKFLEEVAGNIDGELKKLGLKLLNVNLNRISE